ncbi:hypothetical protein ES706_02216 [subsurface metagenome]
MALKKISIREDIYTDLKRVKDPNESFSEVIKRLIKGRKKDPLKHFGIFKDLPKEVMDDFENAILETKKIDAARSSKRFVELWGKEE